MLDPSYRFTGDRGLLGRWFAPVVFYATAFILPVQARRAFMVSFACTILGFATLTQHKDGDGLFEANASLTEMYGFNAINLAFWAVAVIALVRMISANHRHGPQRRQQLRESFARHSPSPAPPVAQIEAQRPVSPAAPAAVSRLILPTSPQRRVRRGGTTLSGIPIKDRRTVDPRSL